MGKSSMAPPPIFYMLKIFWSLSLIIPVFHLKRPHKINTMFHVNIYVEGSYMELFPKNAIVWDMVSTAFL